MQLLANKRQQPLGQASDELMTILEELGDGGTVRRFTVPEFYRLGELAIFQPDERIELIDGLLLVEEPSTPAHAATVCELAEIFVIYFGKSSGVRVRIRNPLSMEVFASEPLPDIALVKARATGYTDRHPYVEETHLVVEVSDVTLELDQSHKLDLYLRAGIPEYWILNLMDRLLEVYRDPYLTSDGKGNYKTKLTFAPEDKVAPLAFPDCQIDLAKVFPH